MGFSSSPLLPFASVLPLVPSSLPISLPRSPRFSLPGQTFTLRYPRCAIRGLGEHVYLNTQAAIKVLQTRLAEDEREHFLHEARIIARFVHLHIVRVLEFGVEGEAPFLVMDYAPGGNLRQHLPKALSQTLLYKRL